MPPHLIHTEWHARRIWCRGQKVITRSFFFSGVLTDGSVALEQDAVGERGCHDLEVGTVQRRPQIRRSCRPPLALGREVQRGVEHNLAKSGKRALAGQRHQDPRQYLVHGHVHVAKTFLLEPVHVFGERVAGFHASRDKALKQRAGLAPSRDMERA